jgi:putative transposase
MTGRPYPTGDRPVAPTRHSIRLPGYDYSQAGAYFITICTHDRACLFGQIVRAGLAPAQMQLNEYGQIAHDQWHQIPERFENIELDQFVVMPNHVHGIIIINESVGAGFTPAPFMGTPALDDKTVNTGVGASPTPTLIPSGQPPTGQPPTGQPQGLPLHGGTVGDIVGAYKSLVANECLKIYKSKNEFMGKLWQRNYYEHIIRDEKSYNQIDAYIVNNPAQWELDQLFAGGTP